MLVQSEHAARATGLVVRMTKVLRRNINVRIEPAHPCLI